VNFRFINLNIYINFIINNLNLKIKIYKKIIKFINIKFKEFKEFIKEIIILKAYII